jgi:glycosyltransferase involved in cell wall biosynthesis
LCENLSDGDSYTSLSQPKFPRIGILNDYVRVPYANGSSFASQFLHREFSRRGSEVTVIGPADPNAKPEELPGNSVCLASLPFRNHPGVQLAFPNRAALQKLVDSRLSMTVAQTGSALLYIGLWLRRHARVPLVCVNTIHLPAVYDVLLPQALHRNRMAISLLRDKVIPLVEKSTVAIYNSADGLVVLSKGLKEYWRARGVTVPISVIARSVDPEIFENVSQPDPFPAQTRRGRRLLVVCRHTREKNVERLLQIFAERIAPHEPEATLTLVGDGPDHDYFRKCADDFGIADRCFWPGEISLPDMPAWYRHSHVFVYTSLSETYGQVVSEALWCGLPAVAMADGMGVSDQIQHGEDGFLVDPEAPDADQCFASRVLDLLRDEPLRASCAEQARRNAHRRSDPQRCIEAYEQTLTVAQRHLERTFTSPNWLQRVFPRVYMTFLHLLLAVLGCIRPPATVNRHGRRQPQWNRDSEPAPASERRKMRRRVPSAA